MLAPSEGMRRDIRKQYQRAGAAPKEFVAVSTGLNGERALAWRNVAHHSTQLYMLHIRRDAKGELEAEHAMITVKCEWKRIGLARPTVKEVEAWQRLVAPL